MSRFFGSEKESSVNCDERFDTMEDHLEEQNDYEEEIADQVDVKSHNAGTQKLRELASPLLHNGG